MQIQESENHPSLKMVNDSPGKRQSNFRPLCRCQSHNSCNLAPSLGMPNWIQTVSLGMLCSLFNLVFCSPVFAFYHQLRMRSRSLTLNTWRNPQFGRNKPSEVLVFPRLVDQVVECSIKKSPIQKVYTITSSIWSSKSWNFPAVARWSHQLISISL